MGTHTQTHMFILFFCQLKWPRSKATSIIYIIDSKTNFPVKRTRNPWKNWLISGRKSEDEPRIPSYARKKMLRQWQGYVKRTQEPA